MSGFDDVDVDRLRRRRSVKWRRHPPDVLAAWVAEMDYPIAPVIREALLEAIDREDYGYPLNDAESGVPEALAGWLRERHGWAADPRRIFLVPDVLKGIELAIETYSPDGTAVVVPTPTYAPFFEVVRVCGRELVPVPMSTVPMSTGPMSTVPMSGSAMDLDRIAAALAAGARTVLISNPQNPTGRAYTAAELAGLMRVVERYGARLISDDVHSPLTLPGARYVPAGQAFPDVITVTSASKAWNVPGLKCAQVVLGTDADAQRWRGLSMLRTHGTTTFGIAATVAAYQRGGPWLDELVTYLDGNRELIGKLLPAGLGYRAPEATYLAWLDCAGLDVPDPMLFFRERARVAVHAGYDFGPGGERHVRLNFATSAALLTRILEAMDAAVRDRT